MVPHAKWMPGFKPGHDAKRRGQAIFPESAPQAILAARRKPMRRILAPLVLAFALAAHAFAQEPAADIGLADRAAIRDVIERQIEAFRRDDGAAAFAFASPAIKRMFGTPETFMDMVRGGYPQVYRPRSVGFGDLLRADDVLVQLVDIVGPDGLPVVAVYEMERQPDGSWQINGCRLLRVPERTT
jgi:hypothetical protein